MTNPPIILNLGSKGLANTIAKTVFGEVGELVHRTFPDGESYIRVPSDLRGRDIVIVADLSDPEKKLIPLLLAAHACASKGAKRIGLVAPYLPYMRQDIEFNPGEAVSSRIFAHLLDPAFDWLLTVDPHLHRIKSLNEIFQLTPVIVNAASKIADWINANIESPVIVGPDEESRQWIEAIANYCDAPYTIGRKLRGGDQCAELEFSDDAEFQGRNVVIVDDIVSTATTILQAQKAITKRGGKVQKTICIHPLFDHRFKDLNDKSELDIISCNTLSHSSNAIDIYDLISEKTLEFLLKKTVPPVLQLV